ncbi:hypothetical protein M426DRAFT_267952 [Hypoxylon sp. CI-4A]|nr:hypothetical protein M426DRAFT_267952 [Hypoxylon sp. CI-4A]
MLSHISTTGVCLLTLLAAAPLSLAEETAAPVPTNFATPTVTQTPPAATHPVHYGHEGPNGLTIVDDHQKFKYIGCYSDTTPAPGNFRSLDGPFVHIPGIMQVTPCLNYCTNAGNSNSSTGKGWKYAGLEFSKECWCGDNLNKHSYHMVDSVCDMPCAGNNKTVCGGHLALTLYNATAPDANNGGNGGNSNADNSASTNQPLPPADDAAIRAVGLGLMGLTCALAFTLTM